jgi:hypothetical protein
MTTMRRGGAGGLEVAERGTTVTAATTGEVVRGVGMGMGMGVGVAVAVGGTTTATVAAATVGAAAAAAGVVISG